RHHVLVVGGRLPAAGDDVVVDPPVVVQRPAGGVGLVDGEVVAVVEEQVGPPVAAEVARIGAVEGVGDVRIKPALHHRAAHRAELRRVRTHPAVVHRPVDAGGDGAAALEHAHGAVVIHPGREGRGHGGGGVDEPVPEHGGAVHVVGAVQPVDRTTRI